MNSVDFDFGAAKASHNKRMQEMATEETARRQRKYMGDLGNWLKRKATGKMVEPDPKPLPPKAQITSFDEFGLAYNIEGPTMPDASPSEDVAIIADFGSRYELPDGRVAYFRGPNDNAPLGTVVEKDGKNWRKELAHWSRWLDPIPFYVQMS